MAVLTPQAVNSAGATPTYAAISSSDTVDVSTLNGLVWLQIKNTGGSNNTLTVVDAGVSPAGNSGVDPAYTIPLTTGDKVIRLRDSLSSAGIITLQNSNTTGGTIGIFYLALP